MRCRARLEGSLAGPSTRWWTQIPRGATASARRRRIQRRALTALDDSPTSDAPSVASPVLTCSRTRGVAARWRPARRRRVVELRPTFRRVTAVYGEGHAQSRLISLIPVALQTALHSRSVTPSAPAISSPIHRRIGIPRHAQDVYQSRRSTQRRPRRTAGRSSLPTMFLPNDRNLSASALAAMRAFADQRECAASRPRRAKYPSLHCARD
jgi:hypothetical protein